MLHYGTHTAMKSQPLYTMNLYRLYLKAGKNQYIYSRAGVCIRLVMSKRGLFFYWRLSAGSIPGTLPRGLSGPGHRRPA